MFAQLRNFWNTINNTRDARIDDCRFEEAEYLKVKRAAAIKQLGDRWILAKSVPRRA